MTDDQFDLMVGNSGPVKDSPTANPWLDAAVMAKYEEAATIAAKAASDALPALERQKALIVSALQQIDNALNHLKFIADGKPGLLAQQDASFSLSGRDVEQVMYEAEDPLKVNEIMDRIKTKFGREWGSSTVYGHLNKLKTLDCVMNSGGRWLMTEVGRDSVAF
jgi:hypothetical protein